MKRLLLAGLSVCLLSLAACGGGEAEPGADGSDGASGAASGGSTDPEALTDEIVENYTACMDELQELTADLPEPDALRPELEQLRDRYIDVFVEIGHRVATHEQETIDQIGRSVMSELYGYDIDWLTEVSGHYISVDADVANMIADLNIITQYAFFDLLRDQSPEEADRLGV